MGTDDLAAEPTPPRRMCESCREFCRVHPDKAIPCGRPGCENTWTWKTGAQLQAALAGRNQEPLRLCDECSRGGFINTLPLTPTDLPEGAEVMPCVVSGCDGKWVWFPGQRLGDARDEAGLEIDKMCRKCRQERGYDLEAASEELSVTEDDLAEPSAGDEASLDPGADEADAAATPEAADEGSDEAADEVSDEAADEVSDEGSDEPSAGDDA